MNGDIKSDMACHDLRMMESRLASSSPLSPKRGDLRLLSGVEVVEAIGKMVKQATNVGPLWLRVSLISRSGDV